MGEKIIQATEEGELIAAAALGDIDCLSELYRRYFPKVVVRCSWFVKDSATADDLAQDVLLKAILKLPSFHEKASFSTWLFTIATNHCLEYLRKEKQHSTVPLEEGMYLSTDEPEHNSQIELLESKLDTFLKQLNRTDRHLLILKYCHNKSIHELQDSYHLTSSAIKMRLKRSKQKLARWFRQSQAP